MLAGGHWNIGMLENWNIGRLDCWNLGFEMHHSNIPLFRL